MWSPGPIIVGAGPAGLATAACLKKKGIPSTIIERSTCIASLWQLRTYDRLRLHLPKHFCELPFMPFPSEYPIYPTKQQFLEYLESYAREFEIQPRFNENVEMARFDKEMGLWRVWTVEEAGGETKKKKRCTTYASRWLVVATGENAEAVVPEIEGLGEFVGPKMHTSLYRNGDGFKGRRVLVVGCGNSGMEVCLDLCNYGANPALVVRDSVHVLPQQVLGCSTFWLSSSLLNWLPVRTVDRFLLFMSWLVFGNTSQFGLKRPDLGPLELKSVTGKTPVLDVGAVAKIRSGHIKVFPAVKRFTGQGAEFVDGNTENFDALVLATGYRSNVPSWLKEREMFSEKDGFPKGWKGKQGLYAVGFRRRGILGASMDAKQVAQDILRSFLFSCSPNK